MSKEKPTKEVEIKEKRTEFSKTLDLGDGKRKLVLSKGPMHYPDGNEYKKIDPTLVDKGDHFEVEGAMYTAHIPKDKVGYEYTSRKGGGVKVDLNEQHEPTRVEKLSDTELIWHDVMGDIDMKLEARGGQLEIFKILKSDNAKKKLMWSIEQDEQKNAKFIERVRGEDGDGEELNIKTRKLNETKEKGREKFDWEEEWTGEAAKIVDKETRKRDLVKTDSFPVEIDATVSETVSTGSDDMGQAYYVGVGWGDVDTNNSYDKLGYGTYVDNFYNIGWRFASIPVPNGAVIDSATLKLYVNNTYNNYPNYATVGFVGDDTDNAGPWYSYPNSYGIETRTLTDASYTYSPVWATVPSSFTVDVSSIVSEIIGRTGWSSNNALALIGKAYQYMTAGTREETIAVYMNSYYADPAKIAEISITYFAEDYSKESNASLPTDDTDLTNAYTDQEYTDVSTSNDTRVSQEGGSGEYVLHLFKHANDDDTQKATCSVELQTDLAPSTSTVHLQAYNYSTASWENVDSNNTASADTDFTLSGTKTGTDYYDANGVAAFRVYQQQA